MRLFINIFILISVFLVFSQSVYADEIVGPATFVFEEPDEYDNYDDYQNTSSSIFQEFIEYATVVQLADQDYAPEWFVDLENDSTLLENITGDIQLGFGELLPNFAVKNEVILDDLAVPSARMNVSTTDRLGSPFHASCVYQELSPEECDLMYNSQDENSDNPLLTSTPLQRVLPRELWLEEQKKLASSYTKREAAAQEYKLKDGLSSSDVARNILAIENVEELQNLSPEERQQLYALEPDKHIVPAVIFVDRVANVGGGDPNFFQRIANSIIQRLFETQGYPKIITTWIPSLKGVKNQSGVLTKTSLPSELGDTINNRQIKTTIEGLKGMSLKEAYEEKIRVSNKQITPPNPKLQFSGATIDSKSTNTTPDVIDQSVDNNNQEQLGEPLSIYRVSLIVPPEVADLFDNQTDLAKTLFPQSLGDFPDSFVEIPLNKDRQQLTVSGTQTTTISRDCLEGETPPCEEEVETNIPKALTFDNSALEFSTVKDWITPYQLYGEKQALRSINDPERFDSTCFWNEFSSKNPGAQTMLALPGNYSSILNTASCPEPLIEDVGSNVSDGVNCNQSVPEESIACFNKDVTASIVDRWFEGETGTNYFRECNNDVISRARAAGEDPVFVLAIWIHESGASNYVAGQAYHNGIEIEDFGVHGRGIEQDFSAQIDFFLTLPDIIANRCGSNDLRTFISHYWFGHCTPANEEEEEKLDIYVNDLEFIYSISGSCQLPTHL